MSDDRGAKPHALYRFFDESGDLLYIGITLNPGRRWRQHADGKPWWHHVTRVEMERHPNRLAVVQAEREAIAAEQPRFNVHLRSRAVTNAEVGQVEAEPDFVAALRLADGRCPIGLVVDWGTSSEWLTLDLYSFWNGTFTAGRVSFRDSDVVEYREAAPMNAEQTAASGLFVDGIVWDMRPLAEYQLAWEWERGRRTEKSYNEGLQAMADWRRNEREDLQSWRRQVREGLVPDLR